MRYLHSAFFALTSFFNLIPSYRADGAIVSLL
jgi:hypothetical protein